MNLISFLDLLSILFLGYALWTLLKLPIRKQKAFGPLLLLVVLYLLNAFPNFVEWLGFEASVEPLEEYIQILVPAAFFIFFTFIKFEESEDALHSRNRVLTAIHTITEKLQVGLSTRELWTDLLKRVINIMGFDGGFINYPADRKLVNMGLKWEGWEQFSQQIELVNIEDTILSEVFMTRKPMVVEQTDNMPDSFIRALNMSGVVSVALFPVSSESTVLGVMGIVSTSPYSFTEEELDLFAMLGHHFGEIIHNNLLIDGSREQAEDLKKALDGRKHFLNLISDDLREPLMRIRTVLQRLSEEMGEAAGDAGMARIIEEANHDSEMLERLIDDVRELAKLDSGSYDLYTIPLDLIKELKRIKDRFQLRAQEKGVELTLRYNDSLSPVEADRDLVVSALRHMLSNAIQYTPDGGQVILDAWEEGDMTCIKVADTGIGIDEGDREKVFDMFYRSTLARGREKVGTGLGLTIVHRIVKLHRGSVSYQPGPEGGAVFTLSFPRLQLEE